MELLRQAFKPEFLNRVDEIIIFNNLSLEHLKTIVDIQLALLRSGLPSASLQLSFSDKANSSSTTAMTPCTARGRSSGPYSAIFRTAWPSIFLKAEFRENDTVSIDIDRAAQALTFETSGKKQAARSAG